MGLKLIIGYPSKNDLSNQAAIVFKHLLHKTNKENKIKCKIESSIKLDFKKREEIYQYLDSLSEKIIDELKDQLNNIHKVILDGLKPNIVFILKVSKNSSKKRLLKRRTKNRYDNFPQSFYSKAQKSFLKIAKNKKNYFIMDSSKNDNTLENRIFNIVSKKLNIS